jgi:hypothetical protein
LTVFLRATTTALVLFTAFAATAFLGARERAAPAARLAGLDVRLIGMFRWLPTIATSDGPRIQA